MPQAQAARPIRIVLAEDHALVRDGFRMLLEATGDMNVVGLAENGERACALVAEHAPDLAVMDIGMPIMSGIEATRRIKASHPSVAIVIVSMHAGRQHITEALRAGALGYVVKDAAVTELLDAVREVAAGRRYVSRQVSAVMVDLISGTGAAEAARELDLLSQREIEILALLANGKTNSESAQILGISTHTVDTHRRNIMTKMGFHNIVDLVKFAIRNGLADSDG